MKINRIHLNYIFCSKEICKRLLKKFSSLNHEQVIKVFKNYSLYNENDLINFKDIVGANAIEIMNKNDKNNKYNRDWTHKYFGNSTLVLKPNNSHQVSSLLKYCNERNLSVNLVAGNTSLVGGAVPINNEIVISVEKMNKIHEFKDSIIHCDSGVILEDIEKYLKEKNYEFPLDLGAKGSCMIGGNLSTNAGGIHFVQYGSLRNNVTEIEVITPNGDILIFNDQYLNLKNLFIGSEGTLGIITRVKCKCFKKFNFKNVSLMKMANFKSVVEMYQKAKKFYGKRLTAIEFYDSTSLFLSIKNLGMKDPFSESSNYISMENSNEMYILMELSSDEDDNMDYFEKYYESLNSNDIIDSLFSITNDQFQTIWKLRERISEASVKEGYCFKYDVSLSLDKMYELVEIVKSRVKNKATVLGYGHLGDCNLHLNVCLKGYNNSLNEVLEVEKLLEPFIFDYLHEFSGSVSAEHGIGQSKIDYLCKSQSENNINHMWKLKKVFDPKLILNPYKLFNTYERMNLLI